MNNYFITGSKAHALRVIWSWALYDFANSAFTTLVVTFIYATYFTQAIASDPISGTVLWSRGITVTALVVAVCAPFLGALADHGKFRKLFVLIATLICVIATASLYTVEPGSVLLALGLMVMANIAFEFGGVFYNAFLPEIAPLGHMGRISGYGWGLGYIGGVAALVLALVGFVEPDTPWLGFSKETGENIRATNLLVAIWFLLFSLPLMIWVKEDRTRKAPIGLASAKAFLQIRKTIGRVRQYRQTVRFLFARMIYNDGLVTIFAFGGIYAAATFGFSIQEVILFGIVLNVTAGAGAFAMGHLDDHIGAKRTIVISLIGLIVASVLGVLATTKFWFWVAGIIIGIFVGPNQSASRSLMGRFIPPGAENEFFGFYAFSGKLTAFLGPFLLGVLTQMSGSQRTGVAVVVIMFIVGLGLLTFVDEKEGIKSAGNMRHRQPSSV